MICCFYNSIATDIGSRVLWQKLVQQVLALPLLLQVVGGPLLDQGLQVVSVPLHPTQQVVQDVPALTVPGREE